MNRRKFLQSTSIVGVAGVAGCLGDEAPTDDGAPDDDEAPDEGAPADETTDLVASFHQEGTAALAQGRALGTVINDNTDSIYLDVRPSGGTRENLGRLLRDETDMAFFSDLSYMKLQADEEPYDGIEAIPYQLHTFNIFAYFIVTTDPDVEVVTDLDGMTISAGPIGAPYQEIYLDVLDAYGIDVEVVGLNPGEFAQGLDSGQIDASFTNILNFATTPPWAQEMIATNDIYIVEFPDGGEAIEQGPLTPAITLEEGEMPDDQNYDRLPDPPYTTYALTYTVSGSPDLDNEIVEEYLNMVYNYGDELGEAHNALRFMGDLSFWTEGLMEDIPVHPATAEFLREHDAWDDSFTVGG